MWPFKPIPKYTADDVVSGKITKDQYVENYRVHNGSNCNPPPDERIFGKVPERIPSPPKNPKEHHPRDVSNITPETTTQLYIRAAAAQEAVVNMWRQQKYLELCDRLDNYEISEESFYKQSAEMAVCHNKIENTDFVFECVKYLMTLLPDADLLDIAEMLNLEYNDLINLPQIKELEISNVEN